MKYLVETLGDYGLHDLFGRQTIHASRPTVVIASAFIEGQKGRKLKVLELLDDDADDATLAKAKSPADLEKAIAALPKHGEKKAAAEADAEPAKPAARPAPARPKK